MLKLVKKGGKLEKGEMASIYGGDCSTYGCDNCGTSGNNYTMYRAVAPIQFS